MSNKPNTTTFSVRVQHSIKKRLEKLARHTGRSRTFLAAQAIHEYLDVSEWQVARIKQAISSLDAGEGISHEQVKDWVASWDTRNERPIPTIV